MSKKLSNEERDNRDVRKIIVRIQSLEKVYESRLVERACAKYKVAKMQFRKAMKSKEVLEEQLAQVKRVLK